MKLALATIFIFLSVMPTFAQQQTDAYWKSKLTPEQYQVTRQHGTERAFSGQLLSNKQDGVYICVCCGAELFDSKTKFDSGTGWPSYYNIIGTNVEKSIDQSYGVMRDEVHCGTCKAHLGHVFADGPEPTGLRYCINSVSLDFKRR